MHHRRGFTLIELLVVIAVIGILASFILVALHTARDKAQDARIKNDLGNIRNQAEMIYVGSSSLSYIGLTTNSDYATLHDDINRQGGNTTGTIFIADKTYAISSTLNYPGGNSWCIDDTGVSIPGRATDTGCLGD